MKVSEMKSLLRKAGCRKVREGGEHERWYSPITGLTFSVSRHDSQELKTKTAESIKRDAGSKAA